jgi:hypothetical protein
MNKNFICNKNFFNTRCFFFFTVFLLVSSTFFVFTPLASASVYSPGISVGQYIQYNVSETPQAANSLSWSRIDVTVISGNYVTMTTSGQYINGSTPQPNTIRYDFVNNSLTRIDGPNIVTTMLIDIYGKITYERVRCDSAWLPSSGIVTAANLASSDSLLWGNTTTEQRTYLGVTRTVNVCRITFTSTHNATVVYDKISGIMLEMAIKVSTLVSAVVSDTNIFSARAHATLWSKAYGGTGYEFPYSVVQTSDSGYAIAGSTNSSGAGGQDFYLVKADANGNMVWSKTFGGIGDDYARSVIQTSDGGYSVAGYTKSSGAGYNDFYLVKADANGNMVWSKTFGGIGDDYAFSVVQTSDGGYAIAGHSYSFGAGRNDFWLVKTDANGNMLWSKTYGGTGYDFAYSLVQARDGGYAIAGETDSSGSGSYNSYLVKADANGNMLWNKTYGGIANDIGRCVVQTADGGYAIAGYTSSFGAGSNDFYLVKADSTGNMQWNKTYGGTGSDGAYSIIQASDGTYALTGWTDSSGAGSNDFWLVSADMNGNILWNQTYGGTNNEFAYSIASTSDDGYVLAGFTYTLGAGNSDFWLIRVASPPTLRVPGVYVGQYATYAVTEVFGNNNSITSSQVQITSITDTNVYLNVSGQSTNGMLFSDGLSLNLTSTSLWLLGSQYSTYNFYAMNNGVLTKVASIAKCDGYWIPRFGPIIGKNLNQGDALWNPTISNGYIQNTLVNTTETRTYLGTSRSVNIVNFLYTGYNETVVYDQSSGMMLEMSVYDKNTSPNRTLEVKLMDTNSFIPPIPETPTFAILIVILAFGASVLLTMNRKCGKTNCPEKAPGNSSKNYVS